MGTVAAQVPHKPRREAMKRLLFLVAWMIAAFCLALAGCEGMGMTADHGGPSYCCGGSTGGDFGATQGGVQDMSFARELIENGQVPPAEAFTVEGMFSEHDLPLTGEPCSTLLCLRGATGVAPTLDGEASGWMQIGMSSTINPETFKRPSITLIATVDVSGSMGWDYSVEERGYPTPGNIARELLTAVAAELGAQDRIAIVTYGSDVSTLMEMTSGDDRTAIDHAISRLTTNGSTNMEAGLERAFQMARDAERTTDQVRVMLFTDMQPNVGATSPTEFEQMAKAAANDDVGLTVMGVGLGLGQEVLNAMVNLKGGNAFSLFDLEDVSELMDDSWPWMVSPIAYGLSVEINLCSGFTVADSYGFPGEEPGLEVATVFLSKRKGALLRRLMPTNQIPMASMCVDNKLSYTTPEGVPVTESLRVAYPQGDLDARGMVFDQPSVGKTVALAVLVSNMKLAAEKYAQARGDAIEIMKMVVDRITQDAQALADPALDPEVQLAQDLLTLMEAGADQGDLYGLR
jgi:Ca-activated chloride channel family protein